MLDVGSAAMDAPFPVVSEHVRRTASEVGVSYASPEFERVAVRGWPRTAGHSVELKGVTAVRWLARAIRFTATLPRIGVPLTDSPAGTELHGHLGQRRRWLRANRLAQGILILPESLEEYQRGRRMQALRTNLRRAKRAGFTCGPLTGGEAAYVLRAVLEAHPVEAPHLTAKQSWWQTEIARPGSSAWYVRDSAGRPLGIAVATVDDYAALLRAMVSVNMDARWLLHTHVVEEAHQRGVRLILTDSSSGVLLEPNIRLFQHLLGYSVANLVPTAAAANERLNPIARRFRVRLPSARPDEEEC